MNVKYKIPTAAFYVIDEELVASGLENMVDAVRVFFKALIVKDPTNLNLLTTGADKYRMDILPVKTGNNQTNTTTFVTNLINAIHDKEKLSTSTQGCSSKWTIKPPFWNLKLKFSRTNFNNHPEHHNALAKAAINWLVEQEVTNFSRIYWIYIYLKVLRNVN